MCFSWYPEMFPLFPGRVSKPWERYVMAITTYVLNLKSMVMVLIGGFHNGMIHFLCYFELMTRFSSMHAIFVLHSLTEQHWLAFLSHSSVTSWNTDFNSHLQGLVLVLTWCFLLVILATLLHLNSSLANCSKFTEISDIASAASWQLASVQRRCLFR